MPVVTFSAGTGREATHPRFGELPDGAVFSPVGGYDHYRKVREPWLDYVWRLVTRREREHNAVAVSDGHGCWISDGAPCVLLDEGSNG